MRNQLIDSFGRQIDYLRVSVTDHCNFRCFYCMPSEGIDGARNNEFLSYGEMAHLIRLFSELGVSKVRFTGGEPLLRRNMVELVRQVHAIPEIRNLSLSTNAHLLERYAGELREAGISRVNISIDSLEPENFSRITRGGDLSVVIRGIDAAVAAGMQPVKLNMVVMKSLNDHEIEAMLEFASQRNVELRFIETMPVGAGIDMTKYFYPADKILERIRQRFGTELIPVKGAKGAGPASYYQVGSGPLRIGVITAMSQHFCAGCNRVRLTAKGELVLCLGRENTISFREPLRNGSTDEELKQLIRSAILRKPERHDFTGEPTAIPLHRMSRLGG